MATAEPLFEYHFVNPTTGGAHSGWRFQAGQYGGPYGSPYQPGDTLIAFVVARTDQNGPGGPDIQVEGISTDGSDWGQYVDYQFDNDPTAFYGDPDPHNVTPGYYSVALFMKTWTEDDDPDTYEVDFTGVTIPSPEHEEVQMLMYIVHGAESDTFITSGEDSGTEGPFAGATFSRNFGDDGGHRWESDFGYADTDLSESHYSNLLYKPGAWWGYAPFGDRTVFAWVQFGSWFFGLNAGFGGDHWRFLPTDDWDTDFGEGGTGTVSGGHQEFAAWTMNMVDTISANAIRISSHRIRSRLSVT